MTLPIPDNPITRWRTDRGLTRRALALAGGINYQPLALVERGYTATIPPAVLRALADLGADADALAREYATWRDAQGLQEREAVGS